MGEGDNVKIIGLMGGKSGSGGWFVVNDDVMGGVSQSRAELSDRRTLQFSGNVSLENNGGFASIRHSAGAFKVGEGRGVRLHVKGDGKTYQLRVRTSNRWDGISYKADFTTVEGKWLDLEIPWDAFEPTFRGRYVPDAPSLKGEEIKQVGFLIADGQAGEFDLEVAAIEPFI